MSSQGSDRFARMVARVAQSACGTVAGAASHAGPRLENQDCAGTAIVEDRLFAAVADGLGGCPDGGHASVSACAHALLGAREALRGPGFGSGRLLTAVVAAFESARTGITEEGRRRGYGAERSGYRSTLVVLLADDVRYAYGYIGDGALAIRRADGRVQELLRPQRQPGARGILCSSLGPRADGEPEFGIAPREPGDLVFLGSDGFFDIAAPQRFAADFHRTLNRSVQEAVDRAVQQVAAARDDRGLICTDNLSLVALRSPVRRRRAL